MLTHPTGLFSGYYISALGVGWPLKFSYTLQPLKCISSRTWGAGRPHVLLFPIFLVLFISPQDLRAPSAGRRETLPHDQCLAEFHNASQKIHGQSRKKCLGPKHAKILGDFSQLPTLIVNVYGTIQYIQNRKDMWSRTTPPAFGDANPVNFSPPPEKQHMWVWIHPNRLIRETIFRTIWGVGPSRFYTR